MKWGRIAYLIYMFLIVPCIVGGVLVASVCFASNCTNGAMPPFYIAYMIGLAVVVIGLAFSKSQILHQI